MADKRIDEVTADAEVTGSEKIPVDDGGTAKFATVAQVKDFVLARIAATVAACRRRRAAAQNAVDYHPQNSEKSVGSTKYTHPGWYGFDGDDVLGDFERSVNHHKKQSGF